jgi:hypothetical protein
MTLYNKYCSIFIHTSWEEFSTDCWDTTNKNGPYILRFEAYPIEMSLTY